MTDGIGIVWRQDYVVFDKIKYKTSGNDPGINTLGNGNLSESVLLIGQNGEVSGCSHENNQFCGIEI